MCTCMHISEVNTVTITFDESMFTCEESTSICTITGRLEGLDGDIQTDFSVNIAVSPGGTAGKLYICSTLAIYKN